MIQATVICDSIAPSDTRLTTMKVTMPRFILAEFNTHRAFSRNAGSSRAISVKRRIQMVRDNPVVPVEWGIEQRGMQANAVLSTQDHINEVEARWRSAADEMIYHAEVLSTYGIHKQVVNRLLEPFSFVDVIVSSTLWENFFTLRCSTMAQPEMRVMAEKMREAYEQSVPTQLEWGKWHMPGINYIEDRPQVECLDDLLLAGCGRIARVSYEANPKSLQEDILLAISLKENNHWSPFEHIARAEYGKGSDCRNFVRDWVQYRALVGG